MATAQSKQGIAKSCLTITQNCLFTEDLELLFENARVFTIIVLGGLIYWTDVQKRRKWSVVALHFPIVGLPVPLGEGLSSFFAAR